MRTHTNAPYMIMHTHLTHLHKDTHPTYTLLLSRTFACCHFNKYGLCMMHYKSDSTHIVPAQHKHRQPAQHKHKHIHKEYVFTQYVLTQAHINSRNCS
jgi:hypothetical protein